MRDLKWPVGATSYISRNLGNGCDSGHSIPKK